LSFRTPQLIEVPPHDHSMAITWYSGIAASASLDECRSSATRSRPSLRSHCQAT
jgi:hypothetical protein